MSGKRQSSPVSSDEGIVPETTLFGEVPLSGSEKGSGSLRASKGSQSSNEDEAIYVNESDNDRDSDIIKAKNILNAEMLNGNGHYDIGSYKKINGDTNKFAVINIDNDGKCC